MALLSPGGKSFNLDFGAFWLPPVLAHLRVAPAQRPYWEQNAQRFAAQVRTADAKTWSGQAFAMMVCTAMVSDCGSALRAFFAELIRGEPNVRLGALPIAPTQFSRFLHRCGWHGQGLEVLIAAAETAVAQPQAKLEGGWMATLCSFFLLGANFADEPMDAVYRRVLVPFLRRAADDPQLLWFASQVETFIYSSYLRRHEDEARFARIYGEIGPLLVRCGRARKATLPALEITGANPPRVGFVLDNPSSLAHTATLLTFLRGMRQLTSAPVEPVVLFCKFAGLPNTITPELQRLGVAFFAGDGSKDEDLVALKRICAREGIEAAVFVSSPLNMSVAAGLRLAPTVIWWSMKYHRFALPEIDGYMTAGAFFEDFRQIEGRTWRTSRTALPPLTAPSSAAEATALKRSLGLGEDIVVLGCIGRDEKLLGDGCLDAIAAVLRATERTVFVWTGRPDNRAPDVKRRLQELGVAERCKFLGWMKDTKVAAQLIDVYLDSFPFASGHTAFEAMAVDVPLVVLKTRAALESSVLTGFLPALEGRAGSAAEQASVRSIFTAQDGELLSPAVETVEAYVARAVRLVRDADFRRRAGEAGRRFVETFARDERKFAETTCRHIVEIIAAPRS